MWGLSLDSSPLSPPSTIQSHPACGHRNSDKRRLANGRGESYNKITSLLSARRSASQNRLQTGCSVSGPGLPGLAGGPTGRQSQLPRKVPLNVPCCLHTLPGLCGLGQSHIGLCWSRPPPSSVLGRVGGGGAPVQEPRLLPSLALGLPALALGQWISLCPSADPAGASAGRGIEELPPLPALC